MKGTRGQSMFVYGLVFVMVALIVLVMLQTTVTAIAPNFTTGTTIRMVVDNIMPLAGVGLLLGVVGVFIGLKLSGR